MLRQAPSPSRSADVMLPCRSCVRSGEGVRVLRCEGDFCWVRTESEPPVEGYVQRAYLQAAVVRRPRTDAVSNTLLRKTATTSREPSVFTDGRTVVANGEQVGVLRQGSRNEVGWKWVRTVGGVEGYLREQYVIPMAWLDTGVAWMLCAQR